MGNGFILAALSASSPVAGGGGVPASTPGAESDTEFGRVLDSLSTTVGEKATGETESPPAGDGGIGQRGTGQATAEAVPGPAPSGSATGSEEAESASDDESAADAVAQRGTFLVAGDLAAGSAGHTTSPPAPPPSAELAKNDTTSSDASGSGSTPSGPVKTPPPEYPLAGSRAGAAHLADTANTRTATAGPDQTVSTEDSPEPVGLARSIAPLVEAEGEAAPEGEAEHGALHDHRPESSRTRPDDPLLSSGPSASNGRSGTDAIAEATHDATDQRVEPEVARPPAASSGRLESGAAEVSPSIAAAPATTGPAMTGARTAPSTGNEQPGVSGATGASTPVGPEESMPLEADVASRGSEPRLPAGDPSGQASRGSIEREPIAGSFTGLSAHDAEEAVVASRETPNSARADAHTRAARRALLTALLDAQASAQQRMPGAPGRIEALAGEQGVPPLPGPKSHGLVEPLVGTSMGNAGSGTGAGGHGGPGLPLAAQISADDVPDPNAAAAVRRLLDGTELARGFERSLPPLTSRNPPSGLNAATLMGGNPLTGTLLGQPVDAGVPIASVGLELPTAHDVELPQQIVRAIRLQWSQGVSEARLRLQPAHLGEVRVSLRIEHGVVRADLQADTAEVRNWIRGHEAELRRTLADQGLDLERLTVRDDSESQQRQSHSDAESRDDRPPRHQPANAPRFEVHV